MAEDKILEKVLALKWDGDIETLKEEVQPEKETRLAYRENDIFLLVVIKDPGEIPRVMPIGIETPGPFISEDFPGIWKDIGDKVRAEISRIVVK